MTTTPKLTPTAPRTPAWRHLAICFCLVVAFGLLSTMLLAAPDDPPMPVPPQSMSITWEKDVCVYRGGEWQLRITYLSKGTRSEGQDGILLKGGVPIEPEKPEQVLTTPIGSLKHYGTERTTRWAVTGWNFSDKLRIKASDKVKVTPKKEG